MDMFLATTTVLFITYYFVFIKPRA